MEFVVEDSDSGKTLLVYSYEIDIVKTSEQWDKYLEENLENRVIVLDPDGWDRQNYQYSYYEELITLDKYNSRVLRSTVKIKNLL